MPLSHKEGFAARSSKITPCFGASRRPFAPIPSVVKTNCAQLRGSGK